jgi:hypothetical protein
MYLYIVYKNFKYYKNYNKFYEIALTNNQAEIKDKYIDKDEYKIEFFATPPEYSQKILKYIQDKFIKSNFPFKIKEGELQATCNDFINKCNQIIQEKSSFINYNNNSNSNNISPPPLLSIQYHTPPLIIESSFQKQKLIALFSNKTNNEMTVLCNNESMAISPSEFLNAISQMNTFQVLQSAIIPANEVDAIIHSFQESFHHLKTLSSDLQLPWYKISEQEVMCWLQTKKNFALPIPAVTSITDDIDSFLSEFDDTDQFLSDTCLENYICEEINNKKRKQ